MELLYLIKNLLKLDELTERFTGSSTEDSIIEGTWVEMVGKKKVYYKEKNRLIWKYQWKY